VSAQGEAATFETIVEDVRRKAAAEYQRTDAASIVARSAYVFGALEAMRLLRETNPDAYFEIYSETKEGAL